MKSHHIAILSLCAATLFSFGCSKEKASESSVAQAAKKLEPTSFNLFFTGSVLGELEPCG